jgi:hypothetical protein
MTKCHSDMQYLSVFYFKGNQVTKHVLNYYLEKEAGQMYQRILNKYKAGDQELLVTLRTATHELLKSERLSIRR